jgi:hypothetical protein
MATMQTAGYEYNGEETVSMIVRPQFTGFLPNGMRPILTDGAGSIKLTYFGSNGNTLVKYADGFQGGRASLKKQKKFTLGEFKSENSWSKQDYASLIQRQAEDIKSAFQNDIFKSEFKNSIPFGLLGLDPSVPPTPETLVSMAEYLIQSMGIAQGIMESFYLADTDKITEKAEGAGTFGNGTTFVAYDEDIRFTAVDGLWKNIYSVASATPTADQVKHVVMNNSAVAQVNIITLTGTSGTANIAVKGVTSLATFDTDLRTTATNFVTAYAAAYLAVGLVLTSSGAGLIFTANVAGVAFDDGTVTNATGDLAGGSVATNGNTVAADLGTDEPKDTFRLMIKGQPKYMKSIPNSAKVILATQSFIENYAETLGEGGDSKATSESQRNVMINGATGLKINGIPVVEMPIDAAIEAYDFGYPHRAILTVPSNLAPILSTAGDFAESVLEWDGKANHNWTRTQLEFGADFWLPELMVVAY